jgi:hypothetical protein
LDKLYKVSVIKDLKIKFTYLITIFTFAIKFPILAHFCTEFVHVRRGRSEVIVQGEGVQVSFDGRG